MSEFKVNLSGNRLKLSPGVSLEATSQVEDKESLKKWGVFEDHYSYGIPSHSELIERWQDQETAEERVVSLKATRGYEERDDPDSVAEKEVSFSASRIMLAEVALQVELTYVRGPEEGAVETKAEG